MCEMTSTSRWMRTASMALALSGGLIAGANPASAETLTPGAPIIGNISAAASTPGTVSVTIRFFRAGTKPSAPVQSHQVMIGSVECVMTRLIWKWEPGDPGPSTTCVVGGIAANKIVKVKVRAKNQFGFGPWSTTVSFRTKAGSAWKRGR